MPVDLTQTNIDPKEYQSLLEDLQGNIIKGYDCDYSVHIFLKFGSDSNAIKKWIRSFAEEFVTSAKQQLENSELEQTSNHQKSQGLFVNFFLSASGYKVLGFELKGKRRKFPAWTFLAGMKVFQNSLKDPPVEEWEKGFQSDIDALILLTDNDCENLQEQAKTVMQQVNDVAWIINTEVGNVLRNDKIQPDGKGQIIEHFGFRDGISQPLFLKPDIEQAKEQGNHQWDSSAPLELVLVKDPFGQGDDSYGSYCVYRKLEQDVQGFKDREQQLAQKLELTGKDVERAGALIVGRFRDGTPITLSPSEQGEAAVLNNFNFTDDAEGTKCPFHAHIRKTNPRGENGNTFESPEEQRFHRIVRRAITYGGTSAARVALQSAISRFQHQLRLFNEEMLQAAKEDKVGLLFLCFQSDIFDQFMFVQNNWANQRDFVQYETGLDAVIGQGKQQTTGSQNWPKEWGKNCTVQFDFFNFVTPKGGEFFFAPSISFLKTIESHFVTRS